MKKVKRIDSLTEEQKSKMKQYVDKWIAIGLRTGETDWDTFDKYMPIVYEKAGLQYPKNVVRVSSPIVGALAASMAESILKNKRATVGDAVSVAVRDAVDGAVHNAVGDAVSGAVYDALGGSLGDAVGGAVRDAVGGAVGDAVGGAIYDAIHNAVYDALKSNNLEWNYWLGGQFWVGYWYWYGVATCDFLFNECGLELSKDIMERAEANRKISESVNYIWPNRDFVMVCARPTKILRDDQGRLHSENGMAIQYPDGWGLYLLHGVQFPEELYRKVTSGTMPFEEILAIEDIDQRTQAMKFGDPKKFLEHVKAKKLDERIKFSTDGKQINYGLYKIPKGEIFTEDAYYLLYDCPSTDRVYMSGVVACNTVGEAMAWKFGTTNEQWSNMVPLKHES